MADRLNEKREQAGTKVMSQLEADAEVSRKKTERLKAIRLAHAAANGTAANAAVTGKRSPEKLRKPGEKALNLSDWLRAQEKEGRRN